MSFQRCQSHLGLVNEIVLAHGPLFHHLDGHVDGPLPLAAAHHAKLTASQLLAQRQLRRVNLPLAVAEPGGGRLGAARRALETAGQSAGVVRVVLDQLGDRLAAVLFRQEIAGAVLFYMVMFNLNEKDMSFYNFLHQFYLYHTQENIFLYY